MKTDSKDLAQTLDALDNAIKGRILNIEEKAILTKLFVALMAEIAKTINED